MIALISGIGKAYFKAFVLAIFGLCSIISAVNTEYDVFFKDLRREMERIRRSISVICYNPLDYAWDSFSAFASAAYRKGQKVMFIGMNPGPDGMGQTGIPFGAVGPVRDYLGICGRVSSPDYAIEAKPVLGFSAKKNEPSGLLFWSLARKYGDRDSFFRVASVYTYCPLLFLTENGGNIALAELNVDDRKLVEETCTAFLRRFSGISGAKSFIALGRYVESKAKEIGLSPYYFQHPSPRNPKGRTFWENEAFGDFMEILDEG